MNWIRRAVFALAAIICAATALAQGIPGTRAYVEVQKGWEAIRDGRHQDAADAFAVAQHELERALELAPSLTDAQLSNAPTRLPLKRLADSFGDLSGDEARLAYAQSAAIVRALFDSGGPLTVGAVLQDIARGDTFATAFEQRMFMSYDTFVSGLATSH